MSSAATHAATVASPTSTALSPEQCARLLADDSFAKQSSEWTALKKSGIAGRERWQVTDAQRGTYFIKRYLKTGLRQQLDRFFRQSCWHSRGWFEHAQCAHLRENGINAPQPLGTAEKMTLGYEQRSVVCMGAVPGDAVNRFWQTDAATLWRTPKNRVSFITSLARFVSAFHQTGRCHRDLYLCHIFVATDAQPTTTPQFSLIDLARIHTPSLRRSRWIVKDLSQLDYSADEIAASRTDRLRFLRAYLGIDSQSQSLRRLVRRVRRKSDAIRRRTARKQARQ